MPAGTPERSDTWRLWNVYYSRLINDHDKPQFLSALSPADHLATFRWLYPADQFPQGQAPPLPLCSRPSCRSSVAIAPTRWPHSASCEASSGSERGPVVDHSNAAIKRLSKQ